MAIALGAGSTERSQITFQDMIKKAGANLIGSQTYLLWKPNDESQPTKSNVKVAVEMAGKFAGKIAQGKHSYKKYFRFGRI